MTASRHMHVVVTCSHRKSRPVPASLRLGSLGGLPTATRLRAWTDRLAHDPTPSLAARELYAGEHWSLASQLPSYSSGGCEVSLWVASAGYGLIPVDAPVRPYAATFSAGHPDAVSGGREAMAEWWAALAGWVGPASAPRSIAQLAAAHPKARLVLVLSAAYLLACRNDVAQAVATASPGRVSIVSAGTKADDELHDVLLPIDGRLQAALGGTLQALNVRVAADLLSSGAVGHDAMRDRLGQLAARAQPRARPARHPLADEEVRAFVREQLAVTPTTSASALLRVLRDSGRACEHSRFARLFRLERAVAP